MITQYRVAALGLALSYFIGGDVVGQADKGVTDKGVRYIYSVFTP